MFIFSQVIMDQTKIRQYLSKVDLFRDMHSDAYARIINDSFVVNYQPEETLFYQGDPADKFFVILEGRVKLSQLTPDGDQVTFHYLKPGEAFGIIAVLRGIQYPVAAEAVETCQVIGWYAKKMEDWIRTYPEIAINSIRILSGFILDFQDRIRELSTERVERRIARTLLRLASHGGAKTEKGISLGLKLTRQEIAEMAGTTLFTVSRTLSKWEEASLVDCQTNLLIITNPHKLTEIAEDIQPKNNI
jgi:CRP-like cAMP-binding protein